VTASLITGGHGFLGWHLACRLRAVLGSEARLVGRAELSVPARIDRQMVDVDVVYHLAGVNRAGSEEEVERGNVEAAESLCGALGRSGRPVHVVYANSIQCSTDTPYGRGKARASELIRRSLHDVGGTFSEVVLPNLFGEHGRPAYNSFVATFCHEVAAGRSPTVETDRPVPLLHAQGAAEALMKAAGDPVGQVVEPGAQEHLVSEVLSRIRGYHHLYGERGEVPDLTDDFDVDLFNTYRSHLFSRKPVYRPATFSDQRGKLRETVRSHGGPGQVFVSTTAPGATRGEHFHLRKVERFVVLSGEAEIALRRLLHEDVVRLPVTGADVAFVDMPTMWAHKITNVGTTELVTMFWSNQLLDPANPDQYAEKVESPT